jgi:hypothetical protein
MKLNSVAIFSLIMLAVGFQQAEWPKVESTKENFTISIPGEPKQKRTSMRGTFGSGHHIYSVESGGISYMVDTSHLELTPKRPQDIRTMLSLACDNFMRETGYKVRILRDRELSLGSFMGRELRLENNKRVRTLRAYIVKDRLYQLTTTEPQAEKQSSDTVKFFESFKLLAPPE